MADFAFERDAAHRLAGRALHAAQVGRNGFGEVRGDDTAGRVVGLGPVERHAVAGAACAAGLAGVRGSHNVIAKPFALRCPVLRH